MSEAADPAERQQQENLLLSFENPNYQFEKQLKSLDQARIDDHLNSNFQPNSLGTYEELCQELKIYTELSGEGVVENNKQQNNRWTYAQLNTQSMGVLSSPKVTAAAEEEEEEEEKSDIPKGEEDAAPNLAKHKTTAEPCDLADGWEMHEDEAGLYFWHIKSGTIQREIPKAFKESTKATAAVGGKIRLSKSSTSSNIARFQSGDLEQKRKSLPPTAEVPRPLMPEDSSSCMQVKVRSLGSIQLGEDSLTNENSSKAVNRCIVQLSTTTTTTSSSCINSSHDSGLDCKELILALNEGTLRLIDPQSGSVLNSQPIHTIRVWGVGRDDSRDFAYVARDKATRCHTCHVFRCEVPARAIANKLRDICKKILIERSLTQSSTKLLDQDSSRGSSVDEDQQAAAAVKTNALARPTHFTSKLKTKTVRAPESFPTPMEEPKKVIKAKFIGELEVGRPNGMETINEAIELSEKKNPQSSWALVNVGVAPSTITISFTDSKKPPIECRVRFLSFLGIGQDSRQCAFIVHTAQDTFLAYAFHCEPHSGPLCKTIEAACTLRYQKCLDARPQRLQSPSPIDLATKKAGGDEQPAKQSHTTIKKALKTIFFGRPS